MLSGHVVAVDTLQLLELLSETLVASIFRPLRGLYFRLIFALLAAWSRNVVVRILDVDSERFEVVDLFFKLGECLEPLEEVVQSVDRIVDHLSQLDLH